MSRTTPNPEDRLARYRPTLDDAIADRTALTSSDHRRADFDLIELDWQPAEPGRSSNGHGRHRNLYLGGPAWDQNLAAPGFIFSLPTGPTAVDVAIELRSSLYPSSGRSAALPPQALPTLAP
jgi:hypothetical protein